MTLMVISSVLMAMIKLEGTMMNSTSTIQLRTLVPSFHMRNQLIRRGTIITVTTSPDTSINPIMIEKNSMVVSEENTITTINAIIIEIRGLLIKTTGLQDKTQTLTHF
jgi:phosphohistidine swiveling domain-containing protein